MRVSVVVPAQGEGDALGACLAHVEGLGPDLEAVAVVPPGTAVPEGCVVTHPTGPGRGAALDAGVAASHGDVLLFLHVDTRLPVDALERLERCLEDPEVAGGWFWRRLADPRWRYRLVDLGANGFSRVTGLATGDQAIFCRRDAWARVGPLEGFPLFEDMTLCRRLRREGRLAPAGAAVSVSARRFHQKGIAATVGTNLWLTARYLAGAPPGALFASYYGDRPPGQGPDDAPPGEPSSSRID